MMILKKKHLKKISLYKIPPSHVKSGAFSHPTEYEVGYISTASRERTSTVKAPKTNPNHSLQDPLQGVN
jgi:hypothetical protein